MEKPWFCYRLRCREGSFYVGITNDVEERVREHNRGKDSAYTTRRRPVELVWSERFATNEEARRREVEIKGWSRRKKAKLVRGNPSASGSG